MRGCARLVAAVATRQRACPFCADDLAQCDLHAWRALRVSLDRRQHARVCQRRFRRNSATYLAKLETRLVKLIFAAVVFFPPKRCFGHCNSAMPSQCPLVHQIARRRLVTVSETRQQRESDHRPWIWRTGLSRSTPPTDSQSAAHRSALAVRYARATAAKPMCIHVNRQERFQQVRPRFESQSWAGCSACAHECALIFVQCSPH